MHSIDRSAVTSEFLVSDTDGRWEYTEKFPRDDLKPLWCTLLHGIYRCFPFMICFKLMVLVLRLFLKCKSKYLLKSVFDLEYLYRYLSQQLVDAALQWHHNGHDSVSNHQPYDCLFNRLFRRGSKKTSKLRVTGLCVRKMFPFDDVIMMIKKISTLHITGPLLGASISKWWLPSQKVSYSESVSICWCYHFLYSHLSMKTTVERSCDK